MAYTTVNDGSAHFQAALYTGNGSTKSVTFQGNANLQPDIVWTKCRSTTSDHFLFDSTRGVTKQIHTNTGDPEGTNATSLTAFDSDGWSMGSTGGMNTNAATYVGWGWKANGGTTSSNSDGSITSTVQANTTARLSIVTYTGNGSSGSTIGHGLSTVPELIIVKRLNSSSRSWPVYQTSMGTGTEMYLDLTQDDTTSNFWITTPTTSVFSVSDSNYVNANSDTYVAYCFSTCPGFSIFGSYQGNADTNGPTIFTGFKPAWVMIKRVDAAESWGIMDNIRNLFNIETRRLFSNNTSGDDTSEVGMDFLSNGFKIRNSWAGNNASGGKYLYIAFASSPFTSSAGVPTTAR